MVRKKCFELFQESAHTSKLCCGADNHHGATLHGSKQIPAQQTPVATGAMSEIYLARMRGIEGFERLVVLKRLKPEIAARAENIAMFLDEV